MAAKQYALSEFSIEAALRGGWEVLKDRWKDVAVLGLVYVGLFVVLGIISAPFEKDSGMTGIINLVTQLVSMFISIGAIRYLLGIVRGEAVDIEMLWGGTDVFFEYLIINIRLFLVIMFGFVLLIVPGIIFAIRYMYVPYLVADGKAMGTEAFVMSKKMTEGRKLTLFLYGLVSGVLVMLGFIALIVGAVVAGAVSWLGSVLIYEYLRKEAK